MSIHTGIGDPWSRSVIIEALQEASEVSGRSIAELTSVKRDKITAQARQAVMWQAHSKGVSYSSMARFFKRDHTTVMHGVKAAAQRIKDNRAFSDALTFKSRRTT